MHLKPLSRGLRLAALCVMVGFAGPFCGGASADLTPPFSVQWGFSAGADPANTGVPVIGGERSYVALRGTLNCLDARTGGKQWEFSPESGAVHTSPVLWKNLVIVGATDAYLYAVDADTGEEVWKRTCAAPVSLDPLILNDMLFVGAEEMVYAIKPESGQATWVCALESAGEYGPLTDGSMLYFLGHDGSVQCVDATQGRYRWRVPLMLGPETFRPLVGGRRAIVATGNWVYGVARSGAVSWRAEMPAAVGAAPTLDGDLLYVPCVDGRIYTLRARSGAPQRGVEIKSDYALTAPPLVADSIIVAGTADGLLCAFDRASGRLLWIYRCRAAEQDIDAGAEFGIYAPVLAADGSLYCLTGAGELYRFSSSASDAAGPLFGRFDPAPGRAVAGGQSLTPTFAVVDDASGVDPSSVTATLDGSRSELEFDVVTGVAVLRARTLPDGPHIVRVTAKDFRGNVGRAEWSFLTDVSVGAAPERALSVRALP